MPKKILLADDSITIQKVVELTFSDGDYEVTAVNNGAKAIQKLSEMRPDIILSDIIMPEKNGYEVCEYVKSHPEHRNIPVVLLTGTFEPFDPDRAEKAGCDAVVTKPFESQSLIHKVEELIAAAPSSAPAATASPAPESASPWEETQPPAPAPSPFSGEASFSPAPAPEPFAHDNDIFGAVTPQGATTEMPFAEPPAPPAPPAPEPSPWDDAPAFSGETRAFPKMSFDDFAKMDAAPAPEPEPPAPAPEPEAEMPFGAPPPAEEFSGETRAFPRMSFEDLQKMAGETPMPEPPAPAAPPPPPPAPEPSPWDEGPAFGSSEPPAYSGETRAFPAMSFDDIPAEPAAPPATTPEPSPWDEGPAFGSEGPAFGEPEPPAYSGETRAFPKMSFEDMQKMVSEPAASEPPPPPALEPEAAPAWETETDRAWSAPEPVEEPEAPAAAAASPASELFEQTRPPFDEPQASSEPEPQPEPSMWAEPPAATAAPESPSIPIAASSLSDDQIDRIARRVVELMSDQVIRNIAWEVIPDLAETAVRERIRQLEAEG
jgi:CheY-like chemotaxis protein